MKKLPVGIQDFSELRRGGYLYVDKTEYIHTLVTGGKYYFLSRPRRFGKSLLVSTMKELFSGSRELFEGLWIEDRWNWEKKNPILHIPFSSIGHKELGLEQALHAHLDEIIEQRDLGIAEKVLSQKFEKVIKKLSSEGQVVLLIDEYDKPIIDYLGGDIEQAKANQQVLKNFYSIIKDSDAYIRLVFITGVSKFSRVSIFSDLNNLDDLTMTRMAAGMLGYTQEELEHYFQEHIKALAEEEEQDPLPKIREWYNGYSWDGRTFVYNPFSILLLFKHFAFSNHWFKTATPTFLIELIRKQEYVELDGIEVSESAFDSFDLDHLNLTALLFQTGYLTVKKYNRDTRLYTLGYPNREVKESMLEYLIHAFSRSDLLQVRSLTLSVIKALRKEDMALLRDLLNNLFRSLPYQLQEQGERFYHATIHLFFKYAGLEVRSEESTALGRSDVVVALQDKVYCFEFKLNKSPEEALEQIKQRGYLDTYRSTGKKLIAVGVNFNGRKCEVELVWENC